MKSAGTSVFVTVAVAAALAGCSNAPSDAEMAQECPARAEAFLREQMPAAQVMNFAVDMQDAETAFARGTVTVDGTPDYLWICAQGIARNGKVMHSLRDPSGSTVYSEIVEWED